MSDWHTHVAGADQQTLREAKASLPRAPSTGPVRLKTFEC